MKPTWRHFALCCITFLQCHPAFAQSPAAVKEATPVDPVMAVLDAFRTHRLVALDEGDHTNLQGYAFRMALIHNPQFAGLVNDIVVEAGNSRYQDVMDKFLAGENVPYDTLRHVWQDTTSGFSDAWAQPIYEEFYRAVRALNSGLPPERRMRVLLGDPPIDWATAKSLADITVGGLSARDDVPVELIRREVLAKGRRALIVYGGMHLQRHDYARNYEPGFGIVEQLERDAPGSVFSIWTNTIIDLKAAQPSVSSWPNPSLAILKGTSLGAQDFAVYYPLPIYIRDKDGKINPTKPTRALRMEEQFDAILYVGPKSSITYSSMSPELCSDQTYVEMRLARRQLLAGPGQGPVANKKCEDILAHGWQESPNGR
jgi:hypothetical protein